MGRIDIKLVMNDGRLTNKVKVENPNMSDLGIIVGQLELIKMRLLGDVSKIMSEKNNHKDK